MEKTQIQRYAESLEKVIWNNHHYLKETMGDFQEKCLVVSSVRTVPPRIVIEIRETHREIQTRLKEITAIQQLLKAKYFLYARRDPMRDKEVLELGFAAKTSYSKFEHGLHQIMEKRHARERKQPFRVDDKGGLSQWFQDKENQVMLLRNWRILNELDYEISPSRVEEKREVVQNRPRSLTLFVFTGEAELIDDLRSRMKLREHDIVERYDRGELRGVLTHLHEISPLEVEKIFQRFKESRRFSKLKSLLLPIRSQKDFEGDIVGLMKKALQEMTEGEVKTLSN
jgi:hypothetical protein